MAKLEDLSPSSLVVVEIPAKNSIKDNETFIEIPTKRVVVTKQSFQFFVSRDGVTPKIIGTPSGVQDLKNPILIGFIPFDKEKA